MFTTVKLGANHIDDILELELKHHPDEKLYLRKTYDEVYDLVHQEKCACYGIFHEHESHLIGYVAYDGYDSGGEGMFEIVAIVIDETWRGHSLGTFLLKKVIHEIQQYTPKRIFLTVAPDNKAAYTLYEHYGFEEYDFKKDVYGPGFDRIYMEYVGASID